MSNHQIVAAIRENQQATSQQSTRPPRPTESQISAWSAGRDDAIIVDGEVYDETAETDHISLLRSQSWFNIACFGTALSKARLLGFNPYISTESDTHGHPHHTSLNEREATLRMISGRYDGKSPRTQVGVPLYWKRRAHPGNAYVQGYFGDPTASTLIESHWNYRGATCLSHSRLEYLTAIPDPGISAALQAEFDLKPCPDVPPPGTVWTTYVGPPSPSVDP